MLYRPLRNGLEQVPISQRLGSQGARRRAPRPRCRHTSSLGIQRALKQGLGSWEPLPEQASLRFCTPSPPCPSDHGLFREHFAEASQPPISTSGGSQNAAQARRGNSLAVRLVLTVPLPGSETWAPHPQHRGGSRLCRPRGSPPQLPSARRKDLDSGEQGAPST